MTHLRVSLFDSGKGIGMSTSDEFDEETLALTLSVLTNAKDSAGAGGSSSGMYDAAKRATGESSNWLRRYLLVIIHMISALPARQFARAPVTLVIVTSMMAFFLAQTLNEIIAYAVGDSHSIRAIVWACFFGVMFLFFLRMMSSPHIQQALFTKPKKKQLRSASEV